MCAHYLRQVAGGKEEAQAALHGFGHCRACIAPYCLNALGIKPWYSLHACLPPNVLPQLCPSNNSNRHRLISHMLHIRAKGELNPVAENYAEV